MGEIKTLWLDLRAKTKDEMAIYESRNKGINHTALWLESLDLGEIDYQREIGRTDRIKSAFILYFQLI